MSKFRFKSTPNPCPSKADPKKHSNPATWVTEGFHPDGPNICWCSEDPKIATVEYIEGSPRRSAALVTALSLGMTRITAHQGKRYISAYVFVGDIFTYAGNELYHAQSQFWRVTDELPKGCPTYEAMQKKGSGVAWVPETKKHPAYVVLNFENLHAERGGEVDAVVYFTVEARRKGEHPASFTKDMTAYAYAPDGVTVWGLEPGGWRTAKDDMQPKGLIPEQVDMAEHHAGMVWAPTKDDPLLPLPPGDSSPALIAAVTCYVLDAGQFPDPVDKRPTFYTVNKQPPTG